MSRSVSLLNKTKKNSSHNLKKKKHFTIFFFYKIFQNSPLGDVLHCPVCFEMYEGRILQCPAGHAVCENCSTQMIECPQCRLKYTGTRNYVMEEVISKFKKMNVNSIKHLDGNLNPQIRSSKIESNAAPVIAAIVVPEVIVEIIPEVVESRRIRTTIADPPIQAGGTYECRMLNCNILLPICRLLNHLRGFHKNVLTSTRGDSNLEANSVFDVVCQSYRHAIQIADMGIFFVIVNVTKEGAKTNLKAWVQQAAPNIIAKSFRFKLKITIGSNLGTYTDVVRYFFFFWNFYF